RLTPLFRRRASEERSESERNLLGVEMTVAEPPALLLVDAGHDAVACHRTDAADHTGLVAWVAPESARRKAALDRHVSLQPVRGDRYVLQAQRRVHDLEIEPVVLDVALLVGFAPA